MKSILITFFSLSFSFSLVLAQNKLPISKGEMSIKALNEVGDSSFQRDLEKEMFKNPKWKKLIQRKKMAVSVIDLRNPELPKFAQINGNHMMYAASLPKIAILLAAMDAFEKGELQETPKINKDIKLMISNSNNQASTRMIDLLGYEKIEEVLTDDRYHFYEKPYGGLWVGKRYASGGNTNREPIKNLSHAATTNQVARYYYLLAYGKLVTNLRSKQMLDFMEEPALHHKFVNTLDMIAPNARLFRKSGSWKTFHADSILVWGKNPNRRYILVALVDDENGEQIIRKLVKPVEKVINARPY